jgi:hypothetical protein
LWVVGVVWVGGEWLVRDEGEGEGGEKMRKRDEEVGPVLGWSVGRRDVGGFVWRVVREGGWEGKGVSVAY